ncbi:MAG: FecR family protein [Chitinophagaceae bacterium]|nr:FecR family protein [Chitinophagaceae bacterium]
MAYIEQQIAQLILKHFSEELDAFEEAELESWLAASPRNRRFFDGLGEEDDFIRLLAQEELDRENRIEQKILQKIQEKIRTSENDGEDGFIPAPAKISRIRRSMWIAAASVIIVLGTGIYFWNRADAGKQERKPVLVKTANDVLPGSDRAILTLSSGQKVELNTRGEEVIMDGELSITNDDGELKYAASGAAVLNTMATPKGGQYKITLSDGSKVWLNAASSITYPTHFEGTAREVSVTGEAYFEVTHDKTKPFIVQTPGGSRVEVLGTHFNVNAYGDEAYQTTTLVEGKVRVVKLSEAVQLQPGFQAKVANVQGADSSGDIAVTEVDVEEATGWKNNLFVFNKADIPFIMRQLSRWYDLDVTYKGEIPKRNFLGKIPRNIPLSQMLSALKLVGVNFEIKDKTLIVSGT